MLGHGSRKKRPQHTTPLPSFVRAHLLIVAALAGGATTAAAQADSALAVAGGQYAASGVYRLLFGRQYRELWATPARYEVLRPGSFAGGLVPVRARAGRQTRSLLLRAPDGREFVFRSVDKDVTPETPGNTGGTLRQRLRQDQTHAQLPAAPAVAGALLDAAGIPHPRPRLVLMSDDPALGPHRAEFRGVVGTLEMQLDEAVLEEIGIPGATDLEDTDDLLEVLDGDPRERVDARSYLRARLMDLLLGDWDRHEGQWRWARLPEAGGGGRWMAIPKDRDYAFADYDGLIPALARLGSPVGVVRFGARYPRLRPLVRAAAPLDARFLAGLPRAAWDSAAAALQGRLTDQAIAGALARMPPEHHARVGARLEQALRARRDALPEVAAAFYLRLAERVEVSGTGAAERVEVTRGPAGTLEVALYPGAGREAVLSRTFHPGETRQVRLSLGGGVDTVRVRGRRGCIWLVVAGSPARVQVDDRSGGPLHLERARRRTSR